MAPKVDPMESVTSGWHLDRTISISLFAGLAIQTFVAIWWAATMQSAVFELDKRSAATDVRVENIGAIVGQLGEVRAELRALNSTISTLQTDVRALRQDFQGNKP